MDGPFIQNQKSLNIPFRGSKNQRWWVRTQWFENNKYHDEYVVETKITK